jgi:hypothetical protein
VPLEDIVTKAHLIIYGTVVAVEARLSSEGRHILRDHHVQPINIVYDDLTPATGVSQQTPVFTAWGGNLVIEGLQISDIVEHNSRRVAFVVGDEAILFAAIEDQMLTLRPTDVFKVTNDAVTANGTLKGFANDGASVPLDQFLARVRELSSRHGHSRRQP